MSDVSKTRAVPGQLFRKTGSGRKIEVDHRAGLGRAAVRLGRAAKKQARLHLCFAFYMTIPSLRAAVREALGSQSIFPCQNLWTPPCHRMSSDDNLSVASSIFMQLLTHYIAFSHIRWIVHVNGALLPFLRALLTRASVLNVTYIMRQCETWCISSRRKYHNCIISETTQIWSILVIIHAWVRTYTCRFVLWTNLTSWTLHPLGLCLWHKRSIYMLLDI